MTQKNPAADGGCANPAPHSAMTVGEARAAILAALAPVEGYENIAIRSALDRVLAADVIAPYDVPAHDNSAMDGYALRFADLAGAGETTLTVVGTAFAGRSFSGEVGAGQAVRIMTGAVLPSGADTVVIQEVVRVEDNKVVVPAGQRLAQNTRRAGEDLAYGKPALLAGKWLSPADIGLLASLGLAEVKVRRRLRVAFFSTGDELASLGTPLAPGEVYDSNRYTLWASLTRLGAEVIDMGVVRDDPEALEAALRLAAEQADVILTTGGVSVGEADFIREMMSRLGQVNFWRIDIKPGRPMAFGRIGTERGQAMLFGLPGNPVAVMVNYHQFVVDALRHLMGQNPLPPRPAFKVRAASAIKKSPGRREFPRGVVFEEAGEWRVRLAGSQGSGVLRSMSEANCYIVLTEAQGSVAVGDEVAVEMFEGIAS
jgi:molybdopterin molybdotransferase